MACALSDISDTIWAEVVVTHSFWLSIADFSRPLLLATAPYNNACANAMAANAWQGCKGRRAALKVARKSRARNHKLNRMQLARIKELLEVGIIIDIPSASVHICIAAVPN